MKANEMCEVDKFTYLGSVVRKNGFADMKTTIKCERMK